MEKEFITNELHPGLKLARDFYRRNPWQRKKMCALYIEKSRMCAAYNSKKTHPLAARYGHLENRTHCEVSCLQQIKQNNHLNGTLFIYRESHDGQRRMARCCNSCLQYVKDRGIRKIVYTTNNGYVIEHLD